MVGFVKLIVLLAIAVVVLIVLAVVIFGQSAISGAVANVTGGK